MNGCIFYVIKEIIKLSVKQNWSNYRTLGKSWSYFFKTTIRTVYSQTLLPFLKIWVNVFESRIAVCVSTKDFIISSLEKSSLWKKTRLSSTILQHLWGWFSNFFRAPFSEVITDSILLFKVDSSYLKWLFIADNSASTLKIFCWI